MVPSYRKCQHSNGYQYVLANQTQVAYVIKPIRTLSCIWNSSLLKLPKLGKVCSTVKEPSLAKIPAVT